jgi:hypothetical protein
MTGGLLQLAAYGEQNLYLNGNPEFSYFKIAYKRYTNFSTEMIQQDLHGIVDFGKKIYCPIDRKADLIHRIYLNVELPALMTPQEIASNPPVYYSWVNSVGNALIRIMDIEIGNQVIDRVYGVWMEIWNELTIDNSRIDAYNRMIGKHDNFNATTQPGPLQLKIPLPFWFCRNIGLALPIVAIQQSNIRINLSLRKWEELIVSTSGQLPTTIPHIDRAFLLVEYIFLETEERRQFASRNHKYLIDQLQVNTFGIDSTLREINLKLDFNHPVKSIYWYIQNNAVLALVPNGGNEWFNFSSVPTTSALPPSDPMIEARFYIEGNEMTKIYDALHYRVVIPYQYHTRVPKNYVYMYSFSLKPEEYQPSGALNVSRIDNFNLVLRLNNSYLNAEQNVTLFASSYNIFEIENGLVGLMYAT